MKRVKFKAVIEGTIAVNVNSGERHRPFVLDYARDELNGRLKLLTDAFGGQVKISFPKK